MTKSTTPPGCWLAFSEDLAATAVFSSEVAALRYAVARGQKVAHVEFGVDLREAVKASSAAKATVPPRGTP
jgi:hypothetical protein